MSARIVTLGEVLGLVRTSTDTLAEASSGELGIGGAEANVAIGLARLGIRSAWLGRVGNDPFGERAARTLRGQGVETHAIVDPTAPTAVMFKERRPFDRTRVHFLRRDSAGSRLTPADLAPLDIASAALLHLTGILPGLSPDGAATSLAALETAREHGVTVSFDINHRPSLWEGTIAAPSYRSIASRADVLFGGADELQLLVGPIADPRELALRAAALGPRIVVVKLGAGGAGALVDGEWHAHQAHRVDVVDTVGAGDAFVAGFLSRLVAGAPTAEALRIATLCGASACTHPGDWEGAPTLWDLDHAEAAEPVAR